MATHSNVLAWKIPWTEEPRRLPSMESQELDPAEHVHVHTHTDTHTSSYRVKNVIMI